MGASLLGFLPPLLHYSSERLIDPRLVAAPWFLEPGQHIRVQTQSDRLLDRPVPCPNPGAHIVPTLGLTGRGHQPINLAFLNSRPSFHTDVCIHPYV
jgi:hypothetical protein